MKRRTISAILGSTFSGFFALLGLGSRQAVAKSPGDSGSPGGMMGGMMGSSMSHMDMQGMMSRGNMMGPMKLGMKLFERHAEITRATDYMPNGIIDTTVSNNPTTAHLIQAHVIEMYNRLAENRPFPYPMSNSVPTMFANSTKYQRSYKLLPTGIQVTETSDDPEMVKVIYAHARELDRFAKDGMPAMMRGMMK
ncbi:MAG TPA: hypothetical protein PK677_17490 [Acidiphilium sp.]|uniref:Uncharacterized protein n=1 Tax=Acidiphilium acidophilum TaxID=76588 RepID=A0AAW9DKK1_ACIAO|nr:hypothetical protein [Acidiphilium acidophilum]MDX5929235.1 hypothetical protein [Acidiphilium acidophilum]HQT90297.1 hypothetical protein [Acidiphilium sp.]HQU25304.1 hypothetical protein [Acidiphilium sp.]